jgi:hypothetical protein
MSGPENKFDPNKYHEEIKTLDKLFVDIGLEAVTSSSVVIEPVTEGPSPTTSIDELDGLFITQGFGPTYTPRPRAERNLVAAWNPSLFKLK